MFNKDGINKIDHILEFPDEVLLTILSFLEPEDIKTIYLTNRYLSSFCFENKIWKAICKRKWSSSPIFKRKPISNWRSYYLKKKGFMDLSGGLSWIEIFSSEGEKPTPRYQNTAVTIGDSIYFIGGQDHPENRYNTIHRFDTETQIFTRLVPTGSAPPKFARHTSTPIGTKIYSHGGFDGFNQHFGLMVYDTIENSWENLHPEGEIPVSRTNHASAAINDCFYIFGGMYKIGPDLVFLNDLFEYNIANNTWTQLRGEGDVPPPKCGHKLFNLGDKLLLFGGGYGGQWDVKYNDIHIYDRTFNKWTKVQTKGDIPVCTFTVSWVVGPFLFVYGGQSVKDDLLTNDLFMLDTVNMEWNKIPTQCTPFPRDMGSGSIVGSTLYMFGGFSSTPLDSLFSLDMSKDFESVIQAPSPSIQE
ncbi:hypothetical protein DICPUDRAFT_41793 [Dictyostelium purpureum]|uniref:F-box domain-containing protein n=1 Tax=Dictyostelium purpureum TaxID=5786 RepID=F1A0T4_DICPU|nr:uncharacterized protein DICPUDRAFT_41793 [Dictyostelium purpureum]EGC30194.1 hypothetical protein DICPUDRAFT_41793 [Dictyostelium purpureum]|eukprot:XP_003293283.1 hypothetical protein DICPUDRAFT_41793 [Dictyostelium purpureum]